LGHVRRRVFLILLAVALAGGVAVAANGTRRAQVTATVTAVGAGDTLTVRVGTAKPHDVHVLGVVAPRGNACYAKESAALAHELALGQVVKLSANAKDAAVTLPDGSDLGAKLLVAGAAQADAWSKPSSRFLTYVPLQRGAESENAGLWGACAADLSVTLTSSETTNVGKAITYTATVANAGPLPAANVDLDVRSPAGNPFETAAGVTSHTICSAKSWYATCEILSLGAGETATMTFTGDARKEGVVSASAVVRLSACASAACGARPLHDPQLENNRVGAFTTVLAAGATGGPPSRKIPLDHWVDGGGCDPHYPTVCIAAFPPKVDCADLSFRAFKVVHTPTPATPDPQSLDNDFDGVGCTFNDY
jgi:endonuclease YncB( thermonuclease family)